MSHASGYIGSAAAAETLQFSEECFRLLVGDMFVLWTRRVDILMDSRLDGVGGIEFTGSGVAPATAASETSLHTDSIKPFETFLFQTILYYVQ